MLCSTTETGNSVLPLKLLSELSNDMFSEDSQSTILVSENFTANLVEGRSVFTKFPDLPTELQLQIWEIALPTARLVALWLKTWDLNDGILSETPEDLHQFLCKNPPPALLHVNRQARGVGLKHLSLRISTPTQTCPIYINPDFDTVYTCNFIASADERFKHIRHLAVPFSHDRVLPAGCSDGYWGGVTDLIARLRAMPRLLDVTFVNHHGRCLLHIEEQFKGIAFSNWKESPSDSFVRMWDMEVALEKALYPEWKVPTFYERSLEMPDGKLSCLPGRRDARS